MFAHLRFVYIIVFNYKWYTDLKPVSRESRDQYLENKKKIDSRLPPLLLPVFLIDNGH